MEDKQVLFNNIDKVHTTEMGIDRIKKNLKLDTDDVVEYCKNKVLDKNCNIYRIDGNPKRKKYKIDTRLNLKNNFMFKVNLRQ